jgi:hypothetical protein
MELLLLAVPFITSIILFGVKWLAGFYMTDNGSCVTSIAGPHGGAQLYER